MPPKKIQPKPCPVQQTEALLVNLRRGCSKGGMCLTTVDPAVIARIAQELDGPNSMKLAAASAVFRDMHLPLTLHTRIHTQFVRPIAKAYKLRELRAIRNLTTSELGRLCEGCLDLEVIDLSYCIRVEELSGLTHHPNLHTVYLKKCSNLGDIDDIPAVYNLTELNVSECHKLESLAPLSQVKKLKVLRICGNSMITGLDDVVGSKSEFQKQSLTLDFTGARNFAPIQELQPSECVDHLIMNSCTDLKELKPILAFTAATKLSFSYCTTLSDLGEIAAWKYIKYLDLSFCGNLRDIDPLSGIPTLQELNLYECSNMHSLKALGDLTELRRLNLARCSNLDDCSSVRSLHKLEWVDMTDCHHLRDVHGFECCRSLRTLVMCHNYNIEDVSCLSTNSSIKTLDLSHCHQLRRLPDMSEMTVERLLLKQCIVLENLMPISTSKTLIHLDLSDCPSLAKGGPRRYAGLESLTKLKVLDFNIGPGKNADLQTPHGQAALVQRLNNTLERERASHNQNDQNVTTQKLLPCCEQHAARFLRICLPVPANQVHGVWSPYIDPANDIKAAEPVAE